MSIFMLASLSSNSGRFCKPKVSRMPMLLVETTRTLDRALQTELDPRWNLRRDIFFGLEVSAFFHNFHPLFRRLVSLSLLMGPTEPSKQ